MKKISKLYISLHIQICKILNKKIINQYIAIFKYKDRVGYFKNVPAFNKCDAKRKVRDIVKYSDFFYGNYIENINDIEVVLIKKEDE